MESAAKERQMDHSWGAWGAATFWLFIAAAAVAGSWEKARRNAEKHETMRRIIEKTGTIDETKLKELFNGRGVDWDGGAPGDGYRALRVVGTIIMGFGAAVALAFLVMGQFDVVSRVALVKGVSVSLAVALVGLGFFFSSRFAQLPPDRGNGPTAK